MANTLTGLIPIIYDAVDSVSRELTGLIPAVYMNATAEQAAVDQAITYPVVGANTADNIIAAATGPDPADRNIATDTMTISKSRGVSFYRTGEEQKGLRTMGKPIIQYEFEQAMRALVNEVETDLAGLFTASSRAYGTPGATPFATAGDFTDAANVVKILKDNGAPQSDLQLVINTAAGANILGRQSQVHMVGSDDPLRRGVILDISGCKIRESAQINTHTKGTGTNYLTNFGAGYAKGVTDIALDVGSGTGLAGDVITFAGDTNKYIMGTALTAGAMAINAPGLQDPLADGVAATIGNSFAANMAFHKMAIHLLARVPAMPEGGDSADDVVTITDPITGLTFQIAMYRQRRRIAYEVGLAWGVKAVKSAHMAILLG